MKTAWKQAAGTLMLAHLMKTNQLVRVSILATLAIPLIQCKSNQPTAMETKQTMEESKDYIGMWVTADGYIRHHLLPENRYDEARGKRESAYRGSYKVTENHIDYKDDTGFTADGDFRNGILYHAGMVLYKQK